MSLPTRSKTPPLGRDSGFGLTPTRGRSGSFSTDSVPPVPPPRRRSNSIGSSAANLPPIPQLTVNTMASNASISIPFFDGLQKKVSVDAFILAVDNVKIANTLTHNDEAMAKLASSYLTDYASQWFMGEIRKQNKAKYEKWSTMKIELQNWFGRKASLGAKAAKYGDLKKRGDETLRQFLTRCEGSVLAIDGAEERFTPAIMNCSTKCYWTYFDVRVRDFFVAGLSPETSRYLELNCKGSNATCENMLKHAEEFSTAGRRPPKNSDGSILEIDDDQVAAVNSEFQDFLRNGGDPKDFVFNINKKKKNPPRNRGNGRGRPTGKPANMNNRRPRSGSNNRQRQRPVVQQADLIRNYSWEGCCWNCWSRGHMKPQCTNASKPAPNDFPGYSMASAILRARRAQQLASLAANDQASTAAAQLLAALPSAPPSVMGLDMDEFSGMNLNGYNR